MPSHVVLEKLKSGASAWNSWRKTDEGKQASLRDIDFVKDCPNGSGIYGLPEFHGYDFSRLDLNQASLRNCSFSNCDFSRSAIHFADLVDVFCIDCNFNSTRLNVSKIGSAQFISCDFTDADLSYCSAEETNFTGSTLVRTNLSNMSLVKADFTEAQIEGACAYGVSVWDIKLDGCQQSNIAISQYGGAITVPTIELAQFISLLVNSKNLRKVIETITSKVVLILGRFSPERKRILDEIKDKLDQHGYLAVLFDFEVPAGRDLTETVLTLASLSKFIVADLTDPKSIPQELTTIIPNLPSVPVQPILEQTDTEYGMFEHFERYPWVLPVKRYDMTELSLLVEDVVESCEQCLSEPT